MARRDIPILIALNPERSDRLPIRKSEVEGGGDDERGVRRIERGSGVEKIKGEDGAV